MFTRAKSRLSRWESPLTWAETLLLIAALLCLHPLGGSLGPLALERVFWMLAAIRDATLKF
jgi:hypothetical protein